MYVCMSAHCMDGRTLRKLFAAPPIMYQLPVVLWLWTVPAKLKTYSL